MPAQESRRRRKAQWSAAGAVVSGGLDGKRCRRSAFFPRVASRWARGTRGWTRALSAQRPTRRISFPKFLTRMSSSGVDAFTSPRWSMCELFVCPCEPKQTIQKYLSRPLKMALFRGAAWKEGKEAMDLGSFFVWRNTRWRWHSTPREAAMPPKWTTGLFLPDVCCQRVPLCVAMARSNAPDVGLGRQENCCTDKSTDGP
jgi:hypothetical protein